MLEGTKRRRLISPALLLAVLLCFFTPFFSVSCSAGVGQMKATVTGMDQVFGGEPRYSGFRPPPAVQGTTATAEQNSRVSPSALIGFVAIVVGVVVGLGLSRPRARSTAGGAASGIALVAVVVNQLMAHNRAQDALDRMESSFRSEVASSSIFGRSLPTPVFEFADEPGFWIVTVLLGLGLAYNVHEIVVLRRASNCPGPAINGTGAVNSGAGGWPPSRLQQPPMPDSPPSRT